MTAIKKIRSILTPTERRSVAALLCLMIVGTILEMLGIGMLFPAMLLMGQSDLAAHHPRVQPILEFLGNPSPNQMILGAMLSLVGIYLIKNLLLAFLAWRQVRFTNDMQVQIQQRLFTAYLRQPYSFHLQRNSSQLGHNLAEASLFTSAINSGLNVITDGMALLGIVTLLLMVEPLGVLIVVVVFVAAAWGFHRFTRSRVTRWGEERQHHNVLLNMHMYQGFGSIKDIKLLGREKNFLEQFRFHNAKAAWVSGSQSFLQQIPRLWLEILAVTGMALLVLSMLVREVSADRIMPTVALFAAAAFRLIPSVNRMLAGVQSMRYSLPSVNLMYEESKLIAAESGSTQEINTAPPHIFQSEISLTNIGYTYANASTPALSNITVAIRKGESVGFIGPSGSGKSTLLDVMLGLLPPRTGNVVVDGQDIQNNLRAWQSQIGYVPQFIYMTDDTLRRNVAFGISDEQIDDLAVQRAIEAAQLDEFVAAQPDGLETVMGERGIRLSGGQRQRIGIARALYHNPAVLVLDEATSALDSATERGVMEAVMALHASKTILIVAHRLSTVEKCDRLYRLERGRVVDEGSPEKMLVPREPM